MAEEGACPICGFERLEAGQENCPQCEADLTCFEVLDSIPDELPEPAAEEQSSIIAVKREPSIAARENESLQKPSAASPAHQSPGGAGELNPAASSTSQPGQIAVPTPVEARPKTRWNLIAAITVLAVLVIAAAAVLQLYHLRHLESGLKEQKTALKQVSSELAQLNQRKPGAAPDKPADAASPKPVSPDKEPSTPKTEGQTSVKIAGLEKSARTPETSERQKLSAEIDSLSTALSESDSSPRPAEVLQRFSQADWVSRPIKPGDTLKSIAQETYGASRYYPILILTNPDMPVDLHKGEGPLKILKDRSKAEQLYDEKTRRIGGRLYFNYTIHPEDTLKGLALKFYRSKKMIKSILDLNPDSQFKPGEQIRIRLE